MNTLKTLKKFVKQSNKNNDTLLKTLLQQNK